MFICLKNLQEIPYVKIQTLFFSFIWAFRISRLQSRAH